MEAKEETGRNNRRGSSRAALSPLSSLFPPSLPSFPSLSFAIPPLPLSFTAAYPPQQWLPFLALASSNLNTLSSRIWDSRSSPPLLLPIPSHPSSRTSTPSLTTLRLPTQRLEPRRSQVLPLCKGHSYKVDRFRRGTSTLTLSVLLENLTDSPTPPPLLSHPSSTPSSASSPLIVASSSLFSRTSRPFRRQQRLNPPQDECMPAEKTFHDQISIDPKTRWLVRLPLPSPSSLLRN